VSKILHFTVGGTPRPKGSKRYVGKGKGGRAILLESSKQEKSWAKEVALRAKEAMKGANLIEGPVLIRLHFFFKSKVNDVKPRIKRPDTDKLARSVFDALTGVCYVDDSQVYASSAVKFDSPNTSGCYITLEWNEVHSQILAC
jgi:crossover junction endodeoxyribonuclease RusA